MKNAGYSYKSQNANVNSGETKGGSPKDTKGGMMGGSDTGLHATNVITVCGMHSKPYSPDASSQSKNK